MTWAVPVFRKDLRRVARLGFDVAIAFTASVIVGVPLILFIHPSLPTDKAFAFGGLFGSICAALSVAIFSAFYVAAQERDAGTDVFLLRLPVSGRRIFVEKICAGILGLVTTWVLVMTFRTLIVHTVGLPEIDDEVDIGSFGVNLAGTLAAAYAIALGLSMFIRQQAAALMASLGVVVCGWLLVLLVTRETMGAAARDGLAAWILLTIVAFVGPGVALRDNVRLPMGAWFRRRFMNLVWKSLGDSSLPSLAAFGLALLGSWVAFAAPEAAEGAYRTVAASVLLALWMAATAVGVVSFDGAEHDGLDNLLHHHPIPMSEVFLAKCVASLPVLCVLAATCYAVFQTVIPVPLAFVVLLLVVSWLSGAAARMMLRSRGGSLIVALTVTWTFAAPVYIWVRWLESTAGGWQGGVWLAASIPFAICAIGLAVETWRASQDRALVVAADGIRRRRYVLRHAAIWSGCAVACAAFSVT